MSYHYSFHEVIGFRLYTESHPRKLLVCALSLFAAGCGPGRIRTYNLAFICNLKGMRRTSRASAIFATGPISPSFRAVILSALWRVMCCAR